MAALGPSFLGIGAQKTGTTWLHAMLRQHPDVGMPEQKELHFWDQQEPEPAAVEAYCAGFDSLRGRAHGEITPSYAILPRCASPQCATVCQDLKLIYIVRNPLERAWSQARMELARRGNARIWVPGSRPSSAPPNPWPGATTPTAWRTGAPITRGSS